MQNINLIYNYSRKYFLLLNLLGLMTWEPLTLASEGPKDFSRRDFLKSAAAVTALAIAKTGVGVPTASKGFPLNIVLLTAGNPENLSDLAGNPYSLGLRAFQNIIEMERVRLPPGIASFRELIVRKNYLALNDQELIRAAFPELSSEQVQILLSRSGSTYSGFPSALAEPSFSMALEVPTPSAHSLPFSLPCSLSDARRELAKAVVALPAPGEAPGSEPLLSAPEECETLLSEPSETTDADLPQSSAPTSEGEAAADFYLPEEPAN